MGSSQPHHQSLLDREPDSDAAWGTIRWLVSKAQLGIDATLGYVEIEPGLANPCHMHPNCTEMIVLLEGELEHAVGDEVVTLRPNDLLVVPAGEPHFGRNIGTTTARMLVFYDSGERQFVAVEAS
jgi:quercetin dioxygenase-like cupin family protein